MCGASGAQKSISAAQNNFFTQLQSSYNQEFAGQEGILNSLTASLSPVLNAGPNQAGFSSAENAALNTRAINQTGANYKNAQQAVGEQLAGRGGGSANLGSGVSAQIQGGIAASAAGELSGEQNQITQANYATGRQNYFQAASDLGATAGGYGANAGAGEATGAGGAAASEANTIAAQGNQWIGALGGALGGAASAFGGGFGTAVGKKI